ncbi:hypothetical protein BHE74_00024947, partial [Ensete ventricosum]
QKNKGVLWLRWIFDRQCQASELHHQKGLRAYWYIFQFRFLTRGQDVYRNISSTIAGVIQGLNATVFAYGSTGSSHAVLEITVKRKQRNQYQSQILRGKLALVDLAGRLVSV